MDSYKRIAKSIIVTAQERIQALLEEVEKLENKLYSSPGSKKLLFFTKSAAKEINQLLEQETGIIASDLLSPPEVDTRLHRLIKLIPVFHILLGFIEGSDVHRSPGQLIQPLRRYARSVIPNSEIIVSSKPELNYSIKEIASHLRNLAASVGSLAPVCAQLPEFLFIVNIPNVESGHILIHGVLSHELGHALYNKNKLADRLLRQIKKRDDLIKDLISVTASRQTKDPVPEILLRTTLTQAVTDRVTKWIIELCSDAIGIHLFGPALFFSAVQLLTSMNRIDNCSDTHPPTKLRIRLMSRILKKEYSIEDWHEEMQSFLKDWDEVAAMPITARAAVDTIAIESFEIDANLDLIAQAAESVVPEVIKYNKKQFKTDIVTLSPLLSAGIPCGELGSLANAISAELPSVINAGWYIYLCEFYKFRSELYETDASSRTVSTRKLHQIILKSLEIAETKLSWKEALNDSKHRANTGDSC